MSKAAKMPELYKQGLCPDHGDMWELGCGQCETVCMQLCGVSLSAWLDICNRARTAPISVENGVKITPDFSNSIKRDIAKALVLAQINACRDQEKLADETLYFYPQDFGHAFEALGWDKGCCIEVEIRRTHRATFP